MTEGHSRRAATTGNGSMIRPGVSRWEFTRRTLIVAGVPTLLLAVGVAFARAYDIFFLFFAAVLLAIALRALGDAVSRRTGLAAGIWLLLQGRSVEDALAQLSLRWGHVRQSRTGILDAFFLRYGAFTRAHGPKPFLDWVREDYDEEALRREFLSRPWADRLVDGVLRRE